MIDFHSHILPLMDDGSKSVEDSINMLQELSRQGVTKVAATPHFYAEKESVESFLTRRNEAFELLKPHLSGQEPQILLGAEIKYYQGISKLNSLKALQLEDSGILLIEMPFSHWTEYTVKEISDIASNGDLTVVIAHIERYMRLGNRKNISRLQNCDVLIQANAEFFSNVFTRNKALNMLYNGDIQLIGTDCHNMTVRRPNMNKAVDSINKKFGNGFLEIINDYQADLLNNK